MLEHKVKTLEGYIIQTKNTDDTYTKKIVWSEEPPYVVSVRVWNEALTPVSP